MKKGFTLIELVMVIVILGIIVVMVLPRFIDLTTRAKEAATQGSLGSIRAAVAIAYASRAAYDITPHIPPSIEASMFQDSKIPYAEVGTTKSNSITYVTAAPTGVGSGWAYDSDNGRVWVNHSAYTTW